MSTCLLPAVIPHVLNVCHSWRGKDWHYQSLKECRHLPVKKKQKRKNKQTGKKKNHHPNKTPNHTTTQIPLKQARGEEPLDETVYCSVTIKLGLFHVLWFCNSSWKLKTFIFFRYNLCAWWLRTKDLKIPLLLKLLLLLDQVVHSPA